MVNPNGCHIGFQNGHHILNFCPNSHLTFFLNKYKTPFLNFSKVSTSRNGYENNGPIKGLKLPTRALRELKC